MPPTIPQPDDAALAGERHAVARERQGGDLRVFGLGFELERLVIPTHAGWHRLAYANGGAGLLHTATGFALFDARRAFWIGETARVEIEPRGRLDLRVAYVRPRALPAAGPCVTLTPLARALIERGVVAGALDPERPRDARLLAVLADELDALEPATPCALEMPRDPRALLATHRCLSGRLGGPDDRPGADSMIWSAEELASEVGCGARTLERLFARETGFGVVAWQRRVRLIAAAAAVAGGRAITDAGLEAGYADTSAFVTAFRRAFGSSPGRSRVRGPKEFAAG